MSALQFRRCRPGRSEVPPSVLLERSLTQRLLADAHEAADDGDCGGELTGGSTNLQPLIPLRAPDMSGPHDPPWEGALAGHDQVVVSPETLPGFADAITGVVRDAYANGL